MFLLVQPIIDIFNIPPSTIYQRYNGDVLHLLFNLQSHWHCYRSHFCILSGCPNVWFGYLGNCVCEWNCKVDSSLFENNFCKRFNYKGSHYPGQYFVAQLDGLSIVHWFSVLITAIVTIVLVIVIIIIGVLIIVIIIISINRLMYHQVNRFYILHIPNPIARRWWMVREGRCQSWIKKDPIALFRPRTPIHLNPDQYPSIPNHPYVHDSSLIPLS